MAQTSDSYLLLFEMWERGSFTTIFAIAVLMFSASSQDDFLMRDDRGAKDITEVQSKQNL